MRPLNLRLSAFGPYAGSVNIPMGNLGNQGLYLITGDTGAGKTTIFDAICYALYGEASGSNRDASMFRSKYADPETPTEVELTFLHGGKEYYVKRNPAYNRPKKRGDGWTPNPADAELRMPDGRVFTKVNEVTAAIEKLLGINRDQFSQIAMLAQGDFLKLLLADTKQRQEIFRELFQTQLYQTLQGKLYNKFKEVDGQVKDENKSVKQYIMGIQVDKDDVLSIEVEKAKKEKMTTEDVLGLLDKLTDQDITLKDKLEEELGKINKNLEEVNQKIGAAQSVEKAKHIKVDAEKKLEEEESKLEQCASKFNEAKTALKKKTELEKEITTIENELPDYNKVDMLKEELEKLKTDNKKNENDLKTKEEERKKTADTIVELKKEQATFSDASAEIEKIKANLEKMRMKAEDIDDLSVSLQEYFTVKQKYIGAQEDYKEKDAIFQKKNALFESMDQAFRDGQAGILAEKLVDGERCPVCGSTSHPYPAVKAGEVPSEKQLDDSKKESDNARKLRDVAAENASGLKKSIETMENELKKKTKKIVQIEDLKEAREKIDEFKSECMNNQAIEKEKLETEQSKAKRKKELDESIPKFEKEEEELKSYIANMTSLLSAGEAKEKEKEKQLAELKKGLNFENKIEAETVRKKKVQHANELQDAYDKAEKNLSKEKEIVVNLKAVITENEKVIKSSKVLDVGAEIKKQAELKKEQEACIAQSKIVTSRLENNERIRSNIFSKSVGVAELEKKSQWIETLSNTANGQLKGKDKVMLETYIQTTYFDRIINRANLRLITMSGGQYELIRLRVAENAQSQSGLDLGVVDHYNGTERSVKTLSGGESFMASLSLALGLSDEVQSSAGGIQIDTMFVDEGFGSLDPEALDMAYKALAGLTEGNRLVGIISHVADLKERIDKQVVVTKEKSGGSNIKMVV